MQFCAKFLLDFSGRVWYNFSGGHRETPFLPAKKRRDSDFEIRVSKKRKEKGERKVVIIFRLRGFEFLHLSGRINGRPSNRICDYHHNHQVGISAPQTLSTIILYHRFRNLSISFFKHLKVFSAWSRTTFTPNPITNRGLK